MSISRVFKTQNGVVLGLRPVSSALCDKCVRVDKATQGKSAEEGAVAYLSLLAELFEEGVTRFKLTQEQAALVVLFRAELVKQMPTLRRNISEFSFFIISLCGGEYPEMTRLALAILEVTKDGGSGKERAKSGFLPFGRLKPAKIQELKGQG